jgi:hypothetical protein
MKTIRTLLFGGVVVGFFVAGLNVRADNLVAAADIASALVNRPIAASPHALEEFPWLRRGYSQPTRLTESTPSTGAYPDNLAAAAAQASALVNRPIEASPHGLEKFPLLLQGYSMPPKMAEAAQTTGSYPQDLAAAAAKASALVNRPIAASPHALEEFPWLFRGYTPQVGTKLISPDVARQKNSVGCGVKNQPLAAKTATNP